MLFTHGSATCLELGFYSPVGDSPEPTSARIVVDCAADMRDAAKRGVAAAHQWLEERGTAPGPICVSFDLVDIVAGNSVGGASGGLAFAVATARGLYGNDERSVAATGELRSGLAGGAIKGVKGVEAKLRAAGERLPTGGIILYPRDNHDEIPGRLQEELETKGLQLYPVTSVAEALDRLYPSRKAVTRVEGPAVRRRSGGWWPVFLLLLIALGLFWVGEREGWLPTMGQLVGLEKDAGETQASLPTNSSNTNRERKPESIGRIESVGTVEVSPQPRVTTPSAAPSPEPQSLDSAVPEPKESVLAAEPEPRPLPAAPADRDAPVAEGWKKGGNLDKDQRGYNDAGFD